MDFSLIGLWSQMGPVAKGVVILLLAMSMYVIGIALDRVLAFRKGRRQSIGYISDLQPLVSDRPREGLALTERWKDAPVARIIGPGIVHFFRELDASDPRTFDPIAVELLAHDASQIMDRVRKRELARLGRGLPALATIASSAPFVGLFGTVFGIITAFQQMADPAKGGGGLASVSAGIAEALLTTAVGLAVAIISLWLYNFFVTRLDDFTGLTEEASGELIESLVRGQRHLHRQAGQQRPSSGPPPTPSGSLANRAAPASKG
jgi:biopolymer transport protein ExbB/TolQ